MTITATAATAASAATASLARATRPAVEAIADNPLFADLDVGGTAARDLLQRQAQFMLVGDGEPSTRELVAQTDAARALLDGADGPRFTEILRGTLGVLDARRGVHLNGVTFADSNMGFALNGLASYLDLGFAEEIASMPADEARVALAEEADVQLRDASEALAWYMPGPSGWVDLGPEVSKHLIAAAGRPQAAATVDAQHAQYVLAHELEHAVTPPEKIDPATGWIEEATADLLSLEQSAADARADGAGMPRRDMTGERDEWAASYAPYVDTLDAVLGVAGIDPSTPEGYRESLRVLQEGELAQVPTALAGAIVQHAGLAGDDAARGVEQLIRDLSGEDPDEVEGLRRHVEDAAANAS